MHRNPGLGVTRMRPLLDGESQSESKSALQLLIEVRVIGLRG